MLRATVPADPEALDQDPHSRLEVVVDFDEEGSRLVLRYRRNG